MNWLTPWWTDFGSFVEMGKHGAYVWPAFGVCALALAGEWWALSRQALRVRQAVSMDAPQPLTPLRQAQGRPSLSPEGRGSQRATDSPPLPLGESLPRTRSGGRGEGSPR